MNGVGKDLTTFVIKIWLFLLLSLACLPSSVVSDPGVPYVLVDAENAVFSAFELVQEAEKLGGDRGPAMPPRARASKTILPIQ